MITRINQPDRLLSAENCIYMEKKFNMHHACNKIRHDTSYQQHINAKYSKVRDQQQKHTLYISSSHIKTLPVQQSSYILELLRI